MWNHVSLERERGLMMIVGIALGLMLHGITYADEDGSGMMSERLWRPVMERGIIQFIRPEKCPIIRPIHKQKENHLL